MAFKNKLGSFVNKIQNKLSKSVSGITTSKGMLHNKILLYVVFIFSLLNLFILANTGNYTSVVVFILIGFITSFFSKNMLVILLLSLILTNILKYGSSLNEGFEDGEKDEKEDENDDENDDEKDEKEDEKEDENDDENDDEKDEKDKKSKEKKQSKSDKDEGFTEDAKKEDFNTEGLEDLQKNTDELMKTISSLTNKIEKFSKFTELDK